MDILQKCGICASCKCKSATFIHVYIHPCNGLRRDTKGVQITKLCHGRLIRISFQQQAQVEAI